MITKTNNSPAFTAHIPNTLGKKACDKLAKKLLESNNEESIRYANDYFISLGKIKKEKGIKEVIIRNSDRTHSPDVWCDGLSVWDLGIGLNPPKNLDFDENRTYRLMSYVKKIANNISNIINDISER